MDASTPLPLSTEISSVSALSSVATAYPRGILIPRSVVITQAGYDLPLSILIYHRSNENGPSNHAPAKGVHIAVVSVEQIANTVLLLERQAGPASCSLPAQVSAPPGYDKFPGYYATLLPGETWSDDDLMGTQALVPGSTPSHVTIRCDSVDPVKETARVTVDIAPNQTIQSFQGYPILDVKASPLDTKTVLDRSDTIHIQVAAAVPNPQLTGWKDIKSVTVFFSAGEPPQRVFYKSNPLVLIERVFHRDDSTTTWSIPASEFWDRTKGVPPGSGAPVYNTVNMTAIVETTTGKKLAGFKRFLLDAR